MIVPLLIELSLNHVISRHEKKAKPPYGFGLSIEEEGEIKFKKNLIKFSKSVTLEPTWAGQIPKN